MKRALLLLVVLLGLVLTQNVSKKCKKTHKAYPGKSAVRPAAAMATAKCSMFDLSCCTPLTEYYMYEHTNNFTNLVFTRVALRLGTTNKAIADNSLTPIVVSEAFNNLVKKDGDVSYQELTKEVLKYFVKNTQECNDHQLTGELSVRVNDPVKIIANRLKAVYKGLDTIKSVLETVTEYKLNDKCRLALMQNGLVTKTDMKNSMCQVCSLETVDVKSCQNTCKNVVRGCINDLTEIEALLNTLSESLDRVHYILKDDLEKNGGALYNIESDINTIFEYDGDYKDLCFTGNPDTFVEKASMAQPANFSSKPLELENVILQSSDFTCILARLNTNCWTKEGITKQDNSVIADFTTQDQAANPVLPRAAVQSQSIVDAENLLRDTNRIAAEAYSNSADLFITEEVEVVPEEPEEEVVDTSDEGEKDIVDEGSKDDVDDAGEEKVDEKEESNEDSDDEPEIGVSDETEGETNDSEDPKEEEKDNEYDVDNNSEEEEIDTDNIEEGAAKGKDSSATILTSSLITVVTSLYFLV